MKTRVSLKYFVNDSSYEDDNTSYTTENDLEDVMQGLLVRSKIISVVLRL